MDVGALTIDPGRLTMDWADAPMPIAFVALDEADKVDALRLPPFPVIGLGDPRHPMGASLDAVIEPPVTAAMLARHVARHPRAAAVLVELLRLTESMARESALLAESLAYAVLQGSGEHAAWLADRSTFAARPPGRMLVERSGTTVRIVIDRPAARNAIDRALRDALYEAFTLAVLDPSIERVEWRATGTAFGVGADLAEFGTTRDPAAAHAIRRLTLPALPLSRRAGIVDVHVQGACVGASLELAAFAGRVTASPRAWFRLPELAMGLIPGAGGCVSVPRRIGRSRAALMMLSGRRIDAATALRWGLIDAIKEEAPGDQGAADTDSGEVKPRIGPSAIEQA